MFTRCKKYEKCGTRRITTGVLERNNNRIGYSMKVLCGCVHKNFAQLIKESKKLNRALHRPPIQAALWTTYDDAKWDNT